MSHSKKKNLIMYTLRRVNDWETNTSGVIYTDVTKRFGWVPSYYTREQLIGKLAINTVYETEEKRIVNNLRDNMDQTRPENYREFATNLFGVMQHSVIEYKSAFFIGKESNGEIEKFDYETIRNAVKDRADKIKSKREKTTKRYRGTVYKFRQGPVENVGHCKWHRGTYYRVPTLHNAVVLNCSCEEETKAFEKSKYRAKNLPVWDDRLRHNDRSWKTHHKVKKQWMKHLDNHVDCARCADKIEDVNYELA